MRALPAVLRSLQPRPTHALFLAFDASPPFFDHDVLPALVSDRLVDVTVLVDSISLHASGIDAGSTRKAGIFYRISGVRPSGGGLFHPKLVCLMHEHGVHVLIGSANVTWSGWCRNVEIVDVLSFGASGDAPPEAALALASFLDDLPTILDGLDADGSRALGRASEALLSAAAATPAATPATGACELLFSNREPLLEQVRRLVPPGAVSRAVFVSPFHDPANSALARVVAAYPKVPFVVIKDGLRADDFDGRSFVALGKQHQLRETVWDDERRPLHAKALWFEGPDDDWLISGSANLTTPAWLRPATDGGNVELVTLRRAARIARGAGNATGSPVDARALLRELPSRKVPDPSAYQFAVPEPTEAERAPRLHIIEAAEEDGRLVLRWTSPMAPTKATAAVPAPASVRLTLRSQDRAVAGSFGAERGPGGNGTWGLDIEIFSASWRAVLDDEIAIVVHLAQEIDSEVYEGSAWLRRTGLLGHNAAVLDLRQRLRRLSGGTAQSPEELLDGIAALLEAAEREPDAFDVRPGAADRSGSGDGASSRERESTASAVLRPALRPLIMPRSAGDAAAHSLVRRPVTANGGWDVRGLDQSAPDEGDETQADPDDANDAERARAEQLERIRTIAEQFRKLVRVAREYVHLTLREGEECSDTRLHATAGLLLSGLAAASLALRQSGADAAITNTGATNTNATDAHATNSGDAGMREHLEAIRLARRELWALAFSIDGWETGRRPGWFPMMAGTGRWAEIAAAAIRVPACQARLLADLAEEALREGRDSIPAEAAYVLQMLGLVEFPPTGDLAQRTTQVIEEERGRDGTPDPEAVLTTLRPAGLRDLRGWRRLEVWLPLVDVHDGRVPGADVLGALPDDLRRGLSPLLRRPDASQRLALVRIEDRATICNGCDTALPTLLASSVVAAAPTVRHCPFCNKALIPVSVTTGIAAAVLAADPARTSRRTAPAVCLQHEAHDALLTTR